MKYEAKSILHLFQNDPLVRLEFLGGGGYGSVYKGVYAMTEDFVAIKYILSGNQDEYQKAL